MGTHGFDGPDRSGQERTVTTTRRTVMGISLGGIMVGLGLRQADAKRKRRCKKKLKRCKKKLKKDKNAICSGKNWCVDRSQTCGPDGSFGKCMVEATGGNICAEILYQVTSCTACEEPSCANCRCALAAGGGDRCNNGTNGRDFICVRPV